MFDKFKKAIEEKKDWNRFQKRIKNLPYDYRCAMEGIEDYVFSFMNNDDMMQIIYDLLNLFEESAAAGKKVTDIIGNDLGVFCEELFKTIPDSSWADEWKKQIKNSINIK